MNSYLKTQTITTTLEPIIGDKFQLAAILPLQKPTRETTNDIPITLHLSKVGADTPLGCYVYSIYDKKNNAVYQTLLNNSEETLVDLTKKIGMLVSKKYGVPTYVSMSGLWSLEDLMSTVKLIVDFIEESY